MRHGMILSAVVLLILIPGFGIAQMAWERFPSNVVLDLGADGSWDEVRVSHPSVLFDGSTYHLWYAGDNGSQQAIGYARSTDGMVWEKYPADPVLNDGPGAVWDGDYVSQPSVLYDGTQYRMWYAGHDGTNIRIGYATSVDGMVWERHTANPVLVPGESGSWDAGGVSSPMVVLEGETYRMWYAGYDGASMKIGYATSADGVVWEKHASNPVLNLGVSGSWDAGGVSSPTVVLEGEIYRMWYAGYDGASMRIGYATSADGVMWSKHASNPVLDLGNNDSWDAEGVSSPTAVLERGAYRMWYAGYDGTNMRIGYATSRRLGDLSGDGTISPYDASLILQFVVGLIEEFPAQQLSAPKGFQMLQNYCVSLPQSAAKAGERIHVPVTIQDATGLFAGGMRVAYDPTVLKAVEVSPLSMLSGSYWQVNTQSDGEVRLAFVTLNPLREAGNLFVLTFDVLPHTEGRVTPLAFSEADFNNSVSVQCDNGSVRILPSAIRLLPNYPNPFNPETTIRYELPEAAPVRLSLYNVCGQKILTLVEGVQPAGIYSVAWNGTDQDGRDVAGGVVLCRLVAGGSIVVQKMVLAR